MRIADAETVPEKNSRSSLRWGARRLEAARRLSEEEKVRTEEAREGL